MKKVLFAALMMFSSVGAFAQHAVGSFNLQPKIGVSIANLTDIKDSDPRVGLVAGVEGEYQVSDIFSISAGALYSMQGAKGTSDFIVASATATTKLDYINVPILTSLKLHEKFSLQVGGQFGFLAVKPEIGSEEPIFYNGENFLDKGIYRNFDFAVIIGCKVRLMEDLAAELRYVNSLTNLFDKQHPALITTEFGNNNVFRHSYLSIGVEYRLKQLTIF